MLLHQFTACRLVLPSAVILYFYERCDLIDIDTVSAKDRTCMCPFSLR